MESTTLDGFIDLFRGSDAAPKRAAVGETLDEQFKNAIEIREFQMNFAEELGKTQPTSGGSGSANPPKRWKFSFEIKKLVDTSSADLFRLYCESLKKPESNSKVEASCTVLDSISPDKVLKALVYLRKGGGQPFVFMTLRFSCVIVHAYEVSWDDDHLVETVKFNAKRCRLEYHPQLSGGQVREKAKQSVDRDFSKTDG